MNSPWSTIDGKVWTCGREQYRARIELIDESYYLAQVMGLDEEGQWQDLVSHRTFDSRANAESHVLEIIRNLNRFSELSPLHDLEQSIDQSSG